MTIDVNDTALQIASIAIQIATYACWYFLGVQHGRRKERELFLAAVADSLQKILNENTKEEACSSPESQAE